MKRKLFLCFLILMNVNVFSQHLIPVSDIFKDSVNLTINGTAGLNAVNLANYINSEQIDISFTYPLSIQTSEECAPQKKINIRFKFNAKSWNLIGENDTILFKNFFFSENTSTFFFNINYLKLKKIKYQGYCNGDIPDNYFYFNAYFLSNFNQYQYFNDNFYSFLVTGGVQSGGAYKLTSKTKFLTLFSANLSFLFLMPEYKNSFIIEQSIGSSYKIYHNYLGGSLRFDIQVNNIGFYFEIAKYMGIGSGQLPQNFSELYFNIGTGFNALGFSLN